MNTEDLFFIIFMQTEAIVILESSSKLVKISLWRFVCIIPPLTVIQN